jgi:predicted RNA-binding protein with PUA-like domain
MPTAVFVSLISAAGINRAFPREVVPARRVRPGAEVVSAGDDMPSSADASKHALVKRKGAGIKVRCWLVRQEPEEYSFADLRREGRTCWGGVRNFQARNNLRAMVAGDPVLFYHSGKERAVVGLAKVVRAAYPDPSDEGGGGWEAVDIAAGRALPRPLPLEEIKRHETLSGIALVRQSRLSVVPLTKEEFDEIVRLASA